ncbi:hypothetical protein OSTOST_05416, partial [Ostertagia ostertagi]
MENETTGVCPSPHLRASLSPDGSEKKRSRLCSAMARCLDQADREFNITQHSLGPLGSCRSKNNDQYLLSSTTDRGDCFRCLIVFPVHENVLQYKSTQCIFDSSMTLDRCRHHFSGDTTMHTLFRKEATAVQCPIEAPLNFTYHTSAGSCSSRISSITRCAEWTRLSFRYQACPENPTKEAS